MKYRLFAFSTLLLLSINVFSQNYPSIIDTIFTNNYTVDGDTIPQSRKVQGYNLNMKLVYELYELWDLEKNAWHFVYKNLYDYIEDGQISLFDPVRALTATIAAELGETAVGSQHYQALFTIGIFLFLITFVINLTADLIVRGIRKG